MGARSWVQDHGCKSRVRASQHMGTVKVPASRIATTSDKKQKWIFLSELPASFRSRFRGADVGRLERCRWKFDEQFRQRYPGHIRVARALKRITVDVNLALASLSPRPNPSLLRERSI